MRRLLLLSYLFLCLLFGELQDSNGSVCFDIKSNSSCKKIKPEPFLSLLPSEPLILARREWHFHRSAPLPDTKASTAQRRATAFSVAHQKESVWRKQVKSIIATLSDLISAVFNCTLASLRVCEEGTFCSFCEKRVVCPRALKYRSN